MSRRSLPAVLAFAAALAPVLAAAQFAAFVLPARFELKAKPGAKLSEVLEIGNDEAIVQEYRIRTSDWTLRPDGGVDFVPDTLVAGSCRPWVAIERRVLKLAGKSKRRYRFEISVPPDAPEGLCRFALLIEPPEPVAPAAGSGIQLPIQGRIGVIVYVRVGEVVPSLTLERLEMANVNGRPTPVAWFRNTGRAHGRPEGTLSGTDANGRQVDFTVAPLPILPGESRPIPIWPQDEENGKPPTLAYPVRLRGTVEWEGGKQPVDATLPGLAGR